MDEKRLAQIEERLARLEEATFGKKVMRVGGATDTDFSGATGGVRFLITKQFFNEQKTLAEVRGALSKNGYHYSTQAVQMAASRLSKRNRPLAALIEEGRKVYVKRK